MREMQEALMRYLASIKAEIGEMMLIVLTLETEQQMIAMLQYISDNSPKEFEMLYKFACKIVDNNIDS